MFEFDYNLIPLNQCIPLKMSDHLICLLCFFLCMLFFFIFGDFSFDLIDFNADIILECLFITILMSGLFKWSFLHSCYHLVVFFFLLDICDLFTLSWFTFFLLLKSSLSFFRFCFVTNWCFLTLFNLVIFPFPILNMLSIGF